MEKMAKEIKNQEVAPKETSDVKIKPSENIDKAKADNVFEKIKSKFNNNEQTEVEKINTRNEDLAGKTHPETGVKFEKKTVNIDGKKIEGVFPKFESKCDVRLPKDYYNKSDVVQFKYCVDQLAKRIEKNPDLAKQFTPKQLEQIKNREPRISGLTWHHSEVPGKMQLVDADIHAKTGHTGGQEVWGGGDANR